MEEPAGVALREEYLPGGTKRSGAKPRAYLELGPPSREPRLSPKRLRPGRIIIAFPLNA